MSKRMPQTVTEIAAVAEAAGQLGIQNDAILSFTETMVNMGVATDMASDEAAMALARFATITQMSQKDFDRLGSTIVGLGNNFAATESEIVEMGLRLAGAGATIGMTEADILSFSTALAAVGINAEAGGTAMSKLMITLANEVATSGDKLSDFAKVADMSAGEFQRAFKNDAAGAITTFIEGLGKIESSGGNVFGVLEELGLTEIRLRDALLRSAGAGDVLRQALDLGSKSWQENTALTTEAEERYKTFASQLKMFWNRLRDVAITLGEALIPALLSALDAAQPFIDKLAEMANWFTELDPKMQTMIIGAVALIAALGPLALGISAVIKVGTTLISVIRGAALAVTLLTRAMLMNPIGLIITGVVALIAGIVLLIKNWDAVKQKVSEVVTSIIVNLAKVLAWFKELPERISKFGKTMFAAGKALFKHVWDGMKDIWKGLGNWVSGKVKWLADKLMFWRKGNKEMAESADVGTAVSESSIDGSHYNGLWRVPFDGYLARLHKGERVLTANQTDAFDGLLSRLRGNNRPVLDDASDVFNDITYEQASGQTVNNVTNNAYQTVSNVSGDRGKSAPSSVNITINEMNVRNENDIKAIAGELLSGLKLAWEAGA